jgi:hypothetical protein
MGFLMKLRVKKFRKPETVTVKGKGKVKATVKKLKAGKQYYFRVRSMNGKIRSEWSKTKSVKAKK